MTDKPMTFAEMVKARGEICAMQTLEIMEEAARSQIVDDIFMKTPEQRWEQAMAVLGTSRDNL